jgi:hypothetical protein
MNAFGLRTRHPRLGAFGDAQPLLLGNGADDADDGLREGA